MKPAYWKQPAGITEPQAAEAWASCTEVLVHASGCWAWTMAVTQASKSENVASHDGNVASPRRGVW